MGLRFWTAMVGLALAGCIATRTEGDGKELGGESHFLQGCSDHCDGDLECIRGICTLPCETTSACARLSSEARCLGDDEQRSCDLGCERDADCQDLGADGFCSAGVCRQVAEQCSDDEERHAVGDVWECSDGCNSCSCHEDGLRTTAVGCGSIPTPPDTSRIESDSCDGVHAVGESFACDCNTCTCNEDGSITTTLIECPAPTNCVEGFEPHELGESWQCSDGCNSCECTENGIARTDLDCSPDDCDVDGGPCDEVQAFTEWQECEDEACLCEMLEQCTNGVHSEEWDFGTNTTRACGLRGNICLLNYFTSAEGVLQEQHCGVPVGRGWCSENPPSLLGFCSVAATCDGSNGEDCEADTECDWVVQTSDGEAPDAGP